MTKKAIFIVGHGSRYPYNKGLIQLQMERLADMGFENIYMGFNETSHPFIVETMKEMAADGMDEVIAVPFFVASGLHMTRDIPPKLGLVDGQKSGDVKVEGKDMKVYFETPFGEDPLLAKILKEKIAEARTGTNTGVLVIGHGSKQPFNKEVIMLNAQRLVDMGVKNVRYAFNEFDEPKIEPVLEELLDTGVDEVLVLPLFMSAGDHLKNDIPAKIHQVDGVPESTYSHKGKDVLIKYLTPIGKDPRLTDVIAEKIRRYL